MGIPTPTLFISHLSRTLQHPDSAVDNLHVVCFLQNPYNTPVVFALNVACSLQDPDFLVIQSSCDSHLADTHVTHMLLLFCVIFFPLILITYGFCFVYITSSLHLGEY